MKRMDRNRLSINLISNIMQFISNLIISFFFTPFIIKSIGIEAYGFYAMAGTFISYIALLTSAINSMASTFITIQWHQQKFKKANEYFNTILFSNLIISIFLGLLIFIFVIFLEKFIEIPNEILVSVRWLFGLVLMSGLISTAGSVFSTATFCVNRLDLKSYVLIGISLLRVIILITLFTTLDPNILFLGVSTMICTILEVLANIVLTKRLMGKMVIKINYFRKKLLGILVVAGIWNSINQLNSILLTGVDILFANIFLSPTVAGLLAISKTIPSLIFSLSSMVGGIFLPQFVISYSGDKNNELKSMMEESFVIMRFFSSIVLAGFCSFGIDFYRLWLPMENSNLLFQLSFLGLLNLFTTTGTSTMGNIFILTNKLKLPVLVTTLRAILGIILVLFYIKYTDYGIYAIAGINSVFGIVYDLFFDTVYAAKCIDLPLRFFYLNKMKMLMSTLVLFIVFEIIRGLFTINNWMIFFISVSICAILGLLFNVAINLNHDQKSKILHRIKLRAQLVISADKNTGHL